RRTVGARSRLPRGCGRTMVGQSAPAGLPVTWPRSMARAVGGGSRLPRPRGRTMMGASIPAGSVAGWARSVARAVALRHGLPVRGRGRATLGRLTPAASLAVVAATSPADTAARVSVHATLQVTFASAPSDGPSIAIAVVDSKGRPIPGAPIWDAATG